MVEDDAIKVTDRARKVLHLAENEALVLGHEYVGTEHILFGLCEEGKGVGAHILHRMGLKPERLHRVLRIAMPSRSERKLTGPLPLSPRAKFSITRAQEEADALKHCYIGTEHLLLGILLPENVAVEFLTRLGIDANEIRQEVFEILGYEDPQMTQESKP